MICHKCIAKLNAAWEFKLLCEDSDAKLRQLPSNLNDLHVTTDLDSFTLDLRQQEENIDKNEMYDESMHFSELTVNDSGVRFLVYKLFFDNF